MTTWPALLMLAGLTTSPSAASSHARRDRGRVEPENRRHRALPDRHRLLHVAAAPAHDPDGVAKRERAGGTLAEYSPRLWPATKSG